MHPENPVGNYERIQVQDLSEEVRKMFAERSRTIQENKEQSKEIIKTHPVGNPSQKNNLARLLSKQFI
jgi:hypothetical protein